MEGITLTGREVYALIQDILGAVDFIEAHEPPNTQPLAYDLMWWAKELADRALP